MNHFAKILRRDATDAERLLWSRLRGRRLGGFRFRRQRPIGNYFCDVVCLSNRLIIELDGRQHVGQADYDAERDAFLRSTGYRVLRLWNGDVMARLDAALETIFEALQQEEMDGRLD